MMPRALGALLTELIDYAGLFPPAELPLPDVVKNYAEYLRGSHRWMLGRLIVPAAMLTDFTAVTEQLDLTTAADATWRLSVLVPAASDSAAWGSAWQQIEDFNQRHAAGRYCPARVDTVEGKAQSVADVQLAAAAAERGMAVFLELPWGDAAGPLLGAIAGQGRPGLRAKLRTGGVTPPAIPPPQVVADFLAAAAEAGVGFKATAGLHHPLRAAQRLTYRVDAPTATMHGFLNVFVAAMLAAAGERDRAVLEQVVCEEDPAAFGFENERVAWRQRSVSRAAILAARRDFAIAFGSCSFCEPIEDLQKLNWDQE